MKLSLFILAGSLVLAGQSAIAHGGDPELPLGERGTHLDHVKEGKSDCTKLAEGKLPEVPQIDDQDTSPANTKKRRAQN